jgi:drug/metabolite transporter (DMT)-like permease
MIDRDHESGAEAVKAIAVSGPGAGANRVWAWSLLLASGIVWGATFSLAKMATTGGAHPLGITLWQGIFGGALLLVFTGLRRRRLPLDRRHLEFYAICGLLGTAVPSTLFFYAASHLSAGVLSITLGTVPLLTFLLAILFALDRASWARLLGLLFGMASIAMIAAPESSLPTPDASFWVLIGVAAASCYALENTFIALRRPRDSDAFTVLCGMLAAAAVMLTPLVLTTETFVPLAWPWTEVEWAIAGMAVINVLGYGTFIYLVTYAGPVFASQEAYVVTLAGVAWGIVLFGEVHSSWVWGALVVMIAGLALIKPHSPSPR